MSAETPRLLLPGHLEAVAAGCVCPVKQNYLQFRAASNRTDFWVDFECPVHKDWVVQGRPENSHEQ